MTPPATSTSELTTASDHSVPLALADLTARCMGDRTLATLLLTKFEKQVRNDLAALERSESARDGVGLARIAHALKGASATMCAARLSERAASTELHAKAGDMAAITHDIAALRDEINRCIAFLPSARLELAAEHPSTCTTDRGTP